MMNNAIVRKSNVDRKATNLHKFEKILNLMKPQPIDRVKENTLSQHPICNYSVATTSH